MNIQQVTVVSKPDSMDTFTFTVVNAYPDLRWTHTSDADLFKVGAAVKIDIGYVGEMQTLMIGEITKISPTFPESGMPTVGVEGHTRLHWLGGSPKTRTFQKQKDSAIVQKIAQDCGLKAQAEDTRVVHEYVMQANQTDLAFVQARAKRIHFEVLVNDRTLIFRRSKEDEPKILTLVWGNVHQGFSPGDDSLPLRSFTPTMSALEQAGEVEVRGYDPQTKKEIIGRAGAGDETRKLGKDAGPAVAEGAFRKPKKSVHVGPVSSQAEADQQAKAIYNEQAMQFLTGQGTTIGVPALRSGKVVDLQGLGKTFNGLYYVEEATHTLGSSGYQTSFSVKRNAAS
jgi:phage protein D